jgi:metallo-beta-lactamase family protein
MTAASLTFLGAVRTVTGSRTLFETPDTSVLVDCGLYQGERELRRRNWQPFPVSPARIDSVLLTHAHLDHCGYVPRLCADGFRGPVHSTRTTAELAEVVLRDSAHLLEEEARLAGKFGWSRHDPPLPLYDSQDAERAVGRLRPVAYDEAVEVGKGTTGTWRPAGHILGSATVELRSAGGRSVLFTGDLGRNQHPLLLPPAPPPAVDAVVLESTYGNRPHPDQDLVLLAAAITRTVARGGTVLIPAFAVDRTEVLLSALNDLADAGEIPDVPIFVDSPMAQRALAVYRGALRRGDRDVRADARERDVFGGRLQTLATPEESMTVNAPDYPCIVISASGMATGGRVLHHLKHQLPDPRNTVLLVGYQAHGTRGRTLLEGARTLKIHGQYVPVRADVVNIQGFSVHADADDMIAWLRQMPEPPQACYVLHGEEESSEAMRDRIDDELGWTAVVPRLGERVVV